MHHRREHRVRAAERAEQERPGLAVALAAFGPDLLDARDVGAARRPTASTRRPAGAGSCRIRCATPQSRNASPPRSNAHGRGAARSSGHSLASGNRSATYSMMASESQTVTSPSISAGTLPERVKLRIRSLSAVPGIERDEDFLESDVAGAQRQPWPHRPRRIVLVADHELQGHQDILFARHSAEPAL